MQWLYFTSKYHTKQLNPWPNSSGSCVVNYSQLFVCKREMEPFEDHPNTHGCLTGPRKNHSKSSLGNIQHQCLPKLLANVHIQLLFDGEKCVLLLCAWLLDFLKSSHI